MNTAGPSSGTGTTNLRGAADLTVDELLPTDAPRALLIGRVYDPAVAGPCVVVVDGHDVVDVSDVRPTVASLLAAGPNIDAARALKRGAKRWDLHALLDATGHPEDPTRARLLAPVDLQVIKAAGVTFVASMLERVIEERVRGDPARAAATRAELASVVGGAVANLRPGSPQAEQVKALLERDGLWSQYLEVAIGPDPEIFTKAPVLAAVGMGQPIGVLRRSHWNNPEPEVVLIVRRDGTPVGASLGNDVNLRDFEGRSALLLTEAKDNNASCAIGPFIRVFDSSFTMDDVHDMTLTLSIDGLDGFTLADSSSMSQISRDPLTLIHHAVGPHHQYPDGFALFTGTMFAPTQDRDSPGAGFTHHVGDVVRIHTPTLGTLSNSVQHCETAPPWAFGISDLMENLQRRNLL